MDPLELSLLIAEGLFPLLALLLFIDFIRTREQARLDITLMLSALALTSLSRILRTLTVLSPLWLDHLNWLGLVIQPFLLLRLVRYFRTVPALVLYSALGGMLAVGVLTVVPQLPPGYAVLASLVYFGLAEGYAVLAFGQSARATGGATRGRLILIAAGSILFAASFVLTFSLNQLRLFNQNVVLVLVLSVCSALGYYYAFATPRWLRRAWQLSELHHLLAGTAGRPAAERAPEMLNLLCRTATRAVGGQASRIMLWDEAQQRMILKHADDGTLSDRAFKAEQDALGNAWREQGGQLAHTLAELGSEGAALAIECGASAAYLVPLATTERKLGLLLVLLAREPLFAADELELLTLLAEQSALTLDYAALVSEQHRLIEQLHQAHEDERNLFFTVSLDMLAIAGFDGNFKRLNPAWTKTLGYTEEELLARPLIDWVHPDDRAATQAEMEKLSTGAESVSFENRCLCQDGSYKWLAWHIAPLVERQMLYAVAHDFSARREAETEVQSRANEFAALYETAQGLTTQQDLQPLLQTIVERAVTLLGAAGGSIFLYDAAQQDLETVVAQGSGLPTGLHFKLGEGMAGQVARSGEPLIVDDYAEWETRSPQSCDVPISAIVQVPMLYRGELIGVLAVNEVDQLARKFTEAEARLLSLFAGQAAGAVHNARLYEETRTRAAQLALLYDAGLALNRVREPHAQVNLLLQVGMRALQADCAEFYRPDTAHNAMRFEVGAGQGEEMQAILHRLNFPIGDPVGIVGWVADKRAPANVPELSADSRHLAINPRLRSGLWVPVEHENQLRGVLAMFREQGPPFTAQDTQLLSLFANQAAVALENARLFAETERHLQQFHAVSEIQSNISNNLDLDATLRVLLDQVTAQMHVDAADVLLLNPHTLNLELRASHGFHSQLTQPRALRVGEGYAGAAALEQHTISIPNLRVVENGGGSVPLLRGEGFVAYYGVPLIAKGKVKGVLEMFHRAPLEPDQEWIEFAQVLAAQAAIAIDDAELFRNLQRSNVELMLGYEATIEGWSRALELRDQETQGHTARVAEMATHLARAMNMSEAELVHLRRGALLHDIGKMGIPDSILLKTTPLSPEEWKIMRRHPDYAYAMLSPITYLRPALDIPYCHHEKWDGSGYPRQLEKEQIPIAARIFTVVDVWDALRTTRRYRAAWEEERVRAYLREMAGKHFDPEVVRVFIEQPIEELSRF